MGHDHPYLDSCSDEALETTWRYIRNRLHDAVDNREHAERLAKKYAATIERPAPDDDQATELFGEDCPVLQSSAHERGSLVDHYREWEELLRCMLGEVEWHITKRERDAADT